MLNSSKVKLKIVYWAISKLRPYGRNPRKNDQAVARMVASIQEFGFAVPILARSTGEVVDGHLRLKSALQLKLAEVPVIICDGWSEAQVKAFRIMVNRSVTWADWDKDALAMEFGELQAMDFDLGLTGFDINEIERYLPPASDPNEDEVPPVPEAPVSRRGDLWLMGEHRLLCGDSTSAEDVARLMRGERAGLMVTDPPYGVDYDPAWRAPHNWDPSRTAKGEVANDDRAEWSAAYKLFSGGVAYIWHSGCKAAESAGGVIESGFDIRAQIIWAKQTSVFGRGAYHWQHEPCWYAVRKGSTALWSGDRTQTTLWQIQNLNPMGGNKGEEATGHGTQKPVECMRRAILNHSINEVYDPFLGSGTTLIAAELTGRHCFGLEIAPEYCDVIVTRWEKLTGKQATLEGHGATFAHVRDGRRLEAQDALKEEALLSQASRV